MNYKAYTIANLASILDTSETAIRKKIKPDENTPGAKRYKQRYKVEKQSINKRNLDVIYLSDNELQEEIQLAQENKSKYGSTNETLHETLEDDIKEAEYTRIEGETPKAAETTLLEFTERYIGRFETLTTELAESRASTAILEDFSKRSKETLNETRAENKTLSERNKELEKELNSTKPENTLLKRQNRIIIVTAITLCAVFFICFLVALGLFFNSVKNPKIISVEKIIEKQISMPGQMQNTEK